MGGGVIHRKNISAEELAIFKAESERKRRISLKKAKAKYQRTDKGKAGAKKYYDQHRDELVDGFSLTIRKDRC